MELDNKELTKEEKKIIRQYRKDNPIKEKENKPKRKRRKHIQHTKLLLNIAMGAFVIVGLCSIYVNLKNGLGMDSVFESICGVIKHLIPCGMAKSFLESATEKRMRLEYLAKGMEEHYDN